MITSAISMESVSVNTDVDNFAEIIFGIHELARGMSAGILGYSKDGVKKKFPYMTPAQNSEDFLDENYETISGAFRLIAAVTGIFGDGIVNDNMRVSAIPAKEAK